MNSKPPSHARPTPPAAPDDAAWSASVQQALGRVAGQARRDAALPPAAATAVPAARSGPWRAAAALALVAALLLGLVAGRWPAADGAAGRERAGEAAGPGVPALAQPVPGSAAGMADAAAAQVRLAVVTESADAGGQRLWSHLAAALDGQGGLALAPLQARGWSDALERLAVDQPRVAALRYDALRLAQHAAPVPLAMVAPLFPHEVQVVVRADSPLRHLHELRGRRINAGPGPGARRLSVRTLYEALFNEPLPAAEGGELDEAPALAALLRGALDAVVLVAAQPAPALAALPADQAAALRLLALDAAHPASRRALETFVPARLQPRRFAAGLLAAPQPTLALMAFLVASGQRGPRADAALGRLAAALCRQRPLLARLDPAWAAWDPRLRLPTGWPVAAPAEAALRDCAEGTKPAEGADAVAQADAPAMPLSPPRLPSQVPSQVPFQVPSQEPSQAPSLTPPPAPPLRPPQTPSQALSRVPPAAPSPSVPSPARPAPAPALAGIAPR